jgi:hypothetical protein
VLAHWVWGRRAKLRGARVLELGAGTALAGLAAAAVGATVTLTDRAEAPQVLANARAAVTRNGLGARCDVAGLSWGRFTPTLLALTPQDLLLGADVLYDSAEFEPLLATVAFLLRNAPPGAAFATAYQHRSRHASLEWRLAKWVRRGSLCERLGCAPAECAARAALRLRASSAAPSRPRRRCCRLAPCCRVRRWRWWS